jgi:predicted RNA-binding protein with PUA-like domain
MAKQHWLIKSEPEEYSIDQFKKDGKTAWAGVRNFQARNFMRDAMKIGDGILFYHSSCDPTAIVGEAEVASAAYPDPTQFDKKGDYYDPKSKPEAPTWMMVDIRYVKTFQHQPTLAELKQTKGLEKMMLLQRGSRLSIQPVKAEEWNIILALTAKG